jgi:hypothetical protein
MAGFCHEQAWGWLCFRIEVSTGYALGDERLALRGLGVVEVAYVVFAPVLGVGLAIAVSLLKRAQNIGIGIPVLLLWQAEEGRHAISTLSTGD